MLHHFILLIVCISLSWRRFTHKNAAVLCVAQHVKNISSCSFQNGMSLWETFVEIAADLISLWWRRHLFGAYTIKNLRYFIKDDNVNYQ